MDKLDEIVHRVRNDLEERRSRVPREALERQLARALPVRDFAGALFRTGEVRLVAELKRASPSAGKLREPYDVEVLAAAYERGGAAALSVLTEANYFCGSLGHMARAKAVHLPVLMKDFLVDPYQVLEGRVHGADAVLLIAALLKDDELKTCLALARGLGMTALVETHDEGEMERALKAGARLVGVNSRNLKDLTVDAGAFRRLLPLIPQDRIKVAESGIKTADDVKALKALGANAVLVGESLLRQPDVEQAARALVTAGQ